MPIKNTLKKICLAGLLVATAALAQTPYDDGQKALREQRWIDAAANFELVVEAKGEQVDAGITGGLTVRREMKLSQRTC